MKKIITATAALLLGISAFADNFSLYYDYTTATGDATDKIEDVANLKKITFKDGQMVAFRKDGTTSSYSIASVQRLYFRSIEADAIEEVKESATPKKGEVYDLMGRKLNIDLSKQQLPKGLYIIDGKKTLVK